MEQVRLTKGCQPCGKANVGGCEYRCWTAASTAAMSPRSTATSIEPQTGEDFTAEHSSRIWH